MYVLWCLSPLRSFLFVTINMHSSVSKLSKFRVTPIKHRQSVRRLQGGFTAQVVKSILRAKKSLGHT